MKKKVLSGLLAIALIFGSAAALPEGVFETSSTITASASSEVDFSYELSENGKYVMITKYSNKTSKTCTIPDTLGGKPVEIIAHAAFRDHTELEKVVFPKSLRGIANVAFKGCTSLRKLDLPGTLTQISESAFEGCTYLESVTIPKGVKTIGKNAFANCECLDSVTIENGVGGIGVGAFSGCPWLTNITIPGSVKTIAVNAFNKCTNLERVTISDGVEFIGAYAFTGCNSLSRLVIPKSVKTIGKDNTASPYSEDNPICDKQNCTIVCYPGSAAQTYAAFNGYKIGYISGDYIYKELKDETVEITGYLGKEKTLTIPSELAEKKVSGIGNGAFANMSDLTSVTIPKGVKSIGDSAFAMCHNLKSITIPSGVTSIGNNAFALCESLKSITIPKGVTSIGISMFFRCLSLESVTIPDGVTTIDRDAFMSCSSLKSVTVPKSVTSFGEHALGFIYDENYKPAVKSGFVIECYKGSAAEKYAKDNSIKYEYVSAKYVAAKKATCMTDGNIEYWKYGNKYYSNKELTKQIDESKIVIKATGHKFSAWKTTGFDLTNYISTQTRKCSVCGNTEKQTTKNAISRFAGANRYDTAALISKGSYSKGADTVIVATGLDFHDALVAVPLANAYNAPLLLATDKLVTKQTEAELARLKAKKVIIVSTNGAVGSAVKTALAKYNPTLISGKTCFETASNVAKALQTKTQKAPDTIFFATDSAFADALSASPVAAIKNAPIIYLKNKGSIDSATANYLKSVKGKVKNAYIIGGDGVISGAMMKNVATALGLTVNKTVVRVAGKNRYETCVNVNNKFKSVLNSNSICVAKGLDFPDALAGGVYAAKNGQALFLADGKKLQDCQNTYLKSKNASKLTIFGGVGAVPDNLVKLIAEASV